MGGCLCKNTQSEVEINPVKDLHKIILLQRMTRGFLIRDKIRLRAGRRRPPVNKENA